MQTSRQTAVIQTYIKKDRTDRKERQRERDKQRDRHTDKQNLML